MIGRSFAFAASAILALASCTTPRAGSGLGSNLSISADGRNFVGEDGRPFFWLGDTAWELFHRATVEEAELYLEDRRRKGFTVIQSVLLAELGGLRDMGSAAALPLIDRDPARPNHAYFRHVDSIVALAESKGLYMALLPTWGDKFNKKWGQGPEIFTPGNAFAYGAFLGRRYKGRRVIWILGGDRNPETPEHFAIIRAMAAGIDSAASGQLMTYHPMGLSKSWQFFGDDSWIDFHMFQSGHGARDYPNYRMTAEGRALGIVRPVIDSEPRYEDHPIDWKPGRGWFDAFDVRQAAWWSMLSGAAGHTYGDHNIWQMWRPGREPISAARTPWTEALDHPGARQMGLMRRYLERQQFASFEPAQHLLLNNPGGARHQVAAATADRTRILVYTPYGDSIAIIADPARPASMDASWFNPRSGREESLGLIAAQRAQVFDPAGGSGRGNDWVLLLRAGAKR